MPEQGSTILIRQFNNVDLPAPVRPTMPIFSPDLILNDISLRMIGRSDLYLVENLSNSIYPDLIVSTSSSIAYFYAFSYSC